MSYTSALIRAVIAIIRAYLTFLRLKMSWRVARAAWSGDTVLVNATITGQAEVRGSRAVVSGCMFYPESAS